MAWSQVYDPLGSPALSTLAAALPIVALLAGLGIFRLRAPIAALIGLGLALAVAVSAFGMPAGLAVRSAALGGAYGLLPIGWIIVNVIFLYRIALEHGLIADLRARLAAVTDDPRLQLLLIAFCLGAFFEGAAGFGTPVAVTAALLIGLGFSPLAASGLSLLANTAPVAYGALGTPVVALQAATGLDLMELSGMIGWQLPVFSVLVPFWLVAAFAGLRGMAEVWPACFAAGASFGLVQYLVSNLHGPWLVDIAAALVATAALLLLLRVRRPAGEAPPAGPAPSGPGPAAPIWRVLAPWVLLCAVVFVWGLPQTRALLDQISAPKMAMAGLHELVLRMPPVSAEPRAEPAVFTLNWLSATGTGILLAALLSAASLRVRPGRLVRIYGQTLVLVFPSLVTISAMLALGFVTRYAGIDATLGLAFTGTGLLYPFFGAMLGWLGVALTGSDTASNVLFGGLQRISAEQLGLSATLMAVANSSGGVMGKMIDAQSIVVASTATHWFGREGDILRYVFPHSLALASLVGLLIMLQAYVWPFALLVK